MAKGSVVQGTCTLILFSTAIIGFSKNDCPDVVCSDSAEIEVLLALPS